MLIEGVDKEGTPVVVETERLLLRPWAMTDLVDFFAIYGDIEVVEHGQRPPFNTMDEARVALHRGIEARVRRGYGFSAVTLKDNGKVIGSCGVRPSREAGTLELGFHFARLQWGNGYATETVVASIEYAFKRLDAATILAYTRSENSRARRVLEKAGLKYVANEQDGDGVWAVYSISPFH